MNINIYIKNKTKKSKAQNKLKAEIKNLNEKIKD